MDEDREGLITEFSYKGRVVKVMVSPDESKIIEVINTSELTETTLMVVVGAPTFGLILEAGLLGSFQLSLQLVTSLMIDAAELNNPS